MKKYTFHFLIAFLVFTILGFSGLKFPGDSVVRFLSLIAGIALLISCLDAVLLSERMKKIRFRKLRKEVKKDAE